MNRRFACLFSDLATLGLTACASAPQAPRVTCTFRNSIISLQLLRHRNRPQPRCLVPTGNDPVRSQARLAVANGNLVNRRMTMKFTKAVSATAIIGMLACAPASVLAAPADAAAPALVVNRFLTAPAPVYYQNHNRYRKLEYNDNVKIYNRLTAVSFTNRSAQPISKIDFTFAAYSDTYRPVLSNGSVVVRHMIATGPFAPGEKYTLANSQTVWQLPPNNGLGCALLHGIEITYADGTTQSVPAAEIDRYLTPYLQNSCGIPARAWEAPGRMRVGPSAYIPGVYPNIALRSNEQIYRQPYVAPSDTQPLCALNQKDLHTCSVAWIDGRR